MARRTFIAFIAALALALFAAGCSGTSEQAAGTATGSPGATDAGIGLSPGGGVGAAGEPSDEETAVATGGDPEEAEEESPEPGVLACTYQRYAYGSYGEPFSLQLTAAGGSGDYRFALAAGEALPEGIALNAATDTLEGTPSRPGEFSTAFTVTDLKENASRECRPIRFTIADLVVKAGRLEGAAPFAPLQKGTSGDPTPTPSRISRFLFGVMGGEWMEKEEYGGFRLQLTLCADAAMSRECVVFAGDSLAGLKRGRWTTAVFDLPEKLPGMSKQNGVFRPTMVTIGPNHRHLSMTQVGKKGPYHVKGVHFSLHRELGRVYTYLNPCFEKRILRDDRFRFGPDDTAICAVVTTGTASDDGDGKDAGTRARIDLLVRLAPEYEGDAYKAQYAESFVRTHGAEEYFRLYSPFFDEILQRKPESSPVQTFLTLRLNWNPINIDDSAISLQFWSGRTVSAGDFLDHNPFSMSTTNHNVWLRLCPMCGQFSPAAVRESQAWLLDRYRVYLFFPGKVDSDGMRMLLAETPRGQESQWVLTEGTQAPDDHATAALVIDDGLLFTERIPFREVKGADQIARILVQELTTLRYQR